jgi:hypothetical protein
VLKTIGYVGVDANKSAKGKVQKEGNTLCDDREQA